MTRRNFPRSVKVAVVKRATRDGVTYCEKCKLPARRFEIDHIIADALGGANTIENAELLCKGDPTKCHDIKTDKGDKPAIAQAKAREASHLHVPPRRKVKIPSPPKRERPERDVLELPPRRSIYEDRT